MQLKSIATQKLQGLVVEKDGKVGDPQDGETASDSDSSLSLEIHDHSPHYDELAASIPSNGDKHLDVANVAPAHMTVDGRPEVSHGRGAESPRRPQPTTLEEQVQEQR
ncbi:hypothetical protein SEVIR_3G115925v4 [Setaria viridis]